MLEYVLEKTSFNSHMCLTPVEQITKYHVKYLSRNFQ